MARSSRYKFWQNFRIAILMAACSVSLGGCGKGFSGMPDIMWQYAPDSYQLGKHPLVDKRVTIPPFTEGRPWKRDDFTWVHMIPLMPFGWFKYPRVELIGGLKIPYFAFPLFTLLAGEFPLANRTGQFSPTIDLTKAAANELSASGVFLEARFAKSPKTNDK